MHDFLSSLQPDVGRGFLHVSNVFLFFKVILKFQGHMEPKIADFHPNWGFSNYNSNYNMTVWILAGNYISFTITAGLIRLHMPGVKKSRV